MITRRSVSAKSALLILWISLVLNCLALSVSRAELVILASASINGPGNGTDIGYGIKADSDGNVYVVGIVSGAAGVYNGYVAKLDADLVLQSSVSIAGPAGGPGEADCLALDPSGNVYVSGRIYNVTGDYDIWIAKYNTDLVLETSATFNGSGNGKDIAYGVTIDHQGNVYATGYVYEASGGINLWVGKFSSDLIFESSATVGGIGGDTPAGFGVSIGQEEDIGHGLATDDYGNVYVAGYLSETAGGANLWVGKFDSSLALLSSATIDGTADGPGAGRRIIVGQDGYVYLTGFVSSPDSGANLWVGKFDSSLALLSSATIEGTARRGSDIGYDLVLDSKEDLYVIGRMESPSDSGGNFDIFLGQFDSSLALKTSATINGTVNGYDVGHGIAVGPDGSLYVVARYEEPPRMGSINIWIAHIEPPLWRLDESP